jgi:hypothetical protein
MIMGDEYDSTVQLAKEMISLREYGSEEEKLRYNNSLIEEMENKLSINGLENPNIKFPSCNYDTYIAYLEESDLYAVATCNNEPWDSLPTHKPSLPLSELPGIGSYEDMDYGLSRLFWFWEIKSDLMIKNPSEEQIFEGCKKDGHWVGKRHIEGAPGIHCVLCFIEENPEARLCAKAETIMQKRLSRRHIFNLRR